MSYTLAQAYVQVSPSFKDGGKEIVKHYEKQGDEAGRVAGKKLGEGINRSLKNFDAKGLVDFGKKAALGFGLATAAGFKLAGAAGDLSAAVGATEQIMGSAAKATIDWSKTSVESVALSQRAALEAANGFALFGEKADMAGDDLSKFSIDMVSLAADMAAFKNISPQQAIEDLTSALAGSSETMTKYGVDVRENALKQEYLAMTGEKVTGTLTIGQRTMALYSAVMKQTTTIQGQLGRENDQLTTKQARMAAQVEDASAAIGEGFIPVATAASSLVTTFAGGFATLNDATGGAVAELAAVGTGLLGMAAAGSLAVGKGAQVLQWFDQLGPAASRATLALGAVGLALTAGYVIYRTFTGGNAEAAARVRDAADALTEQTQAALDNANAIRDAGGEVDSLAVANDALALAITSTGDSGSSLVRALGDIGLSAGDAAEVLVRMQDDGVGAMRDLAMQAGATADEADFLAKALGNGGTLAASSQAAVVSFGESLGMTRDEAISLRERLEPLAEKLATIRDNATEVNLDEVADEWMDSAIGDGTLDAALVKQAESIAGVSREGDGAAEVYTALVGILSEMTEGEQAAALGADQQADAVAGAADAGEDLNTVAADSIDITDDLASGFEIAAAAASGFSDAFDELVGSNLDLEAASSDLLEAQQELTDKIKQATKAGDEEALSLDLTTKAGRENRDMVRDLIQKNVDYVNAMIQSGASVDEVSDAVEWNTEALVGQLTQMIGNEDQARALIEQYGLTPENVDTMIELSGDEAAKARVENHISQLGQIPPEELTEIQALIDAGNYAAAEAELEHLTRARTVGVSIGIAGGAAITGAVKKKASSIGGVIKSAEGRFVPGGSNLLSTLGETPGRRGDEVILPLGDPARMAQLVSDPSVLGRLAPVVEALVDVPQLGVSDLRVADQTPKSNTFQTTVITPSFDLDREMRRQKLMAGVG